MSELANSDLALRQVEYYMSDGNYPFDTYLQSLVREADGCVPLEKLVEFPRLKKLVDGDVAKLRDALGATDSLAFSDARDGVRRLHPTPDDDPARERSVHVTGFPKGAGEEGVKAALAKYGAVASVRLLRNLNQDTRQLDGSAIVAYEGADGAAAAAGAGTGGMVAHAGSMLTIKPLGAWFDKIKQDRARRLEGGGGAKRAGGGEGGDDGGSAKKKQKREPEPVVVELTVLEDAVLTLAARRGARAGRG